MKFQYSLQFNAVPEWISKYIDYSALKKLIYTLEKSQASVADDAESQALIAQDPEEAFAKAIANELHKIEDFYAEIEAKLYDELDYVLDDLGEYERRFDQMNLAGAGHTSGADDEFDDDMSGQDTSMFRESYQERREEPRRRSVSSAVSDSDAGPATSQSGGGSLPRQPGRMSSSQRLRFASSFDGDDEQDHQALVERRRSSDRRLSWGGSRRMSVSPRALLTDFGITVKKRAAASYLSLSELKSYVDLNKTGFRKALKKFDKILNRDLKNKLFANLIEKSYPFSPSTAERLDERIADAVAAYAKVATNDDIAEADKQLRMQLREHIVWERNTVWRDLIGMERKTKGTTVGGQAQGEKPGIVNVGGHKFPSWMCSTSTFSLIAIAIVFGVLLANPVFKSTAQSHCLAVVVAASLLWATEAMPLFVTSLLVPLLIVVLRIPLDDNGKRMSAPDASKFIFSQMWSSVIMILLGGFTLAAALSKYNIAKIVATSMLARAGSNPKAVLLALMFVATFLSMWISNVAAPVLCYSIAQPLLRRVNRNDPFARAIILGVALASNIGGMVSPIASPQNIIAIENMDPPPSWGQWFTVAIPVSLLGLLLVWLFLVLTFPTKSLGEITHVRQNEDKMTLIQWYICFVSVLTIALWCLSRQLEPIVGEMGVLAIVPIVMLFGTGLLTAADFNNFLWTIVALAMGGVALGKAVSSSGLLATIAHSIETQIRGYSLFGIACIFGLMILTVATFVSHTVAALIILPLVRSIGERLSDPHPRLLVMVCALLCSAAMGLPTSGFPNVTAICMTDDLGKPYLTVGSFISRGVPSSVLVYAVIVTVGYSLMVSLGF